MKFEWDPKKAAVNLDTHGVDFEQASTVFGDPLATTIPDPDHSVGESRLLTMATLVSGKLIVVSHTDRGDTIRIISARPATRAERRRYEEGEN